MRSAPAAPILLSHIEGRKRAGASGTLAACVVGSLSKSAPADLAAAVGALEGDFSSWRPSYNIPPTATIPVLVEAKLPESEEFGRRLEPARWGLTPGWSKELKTKFPTFNARAEGIAEKNTWRGPLRSHRAIIPMDGWYEWTGEKGAKTPHFIHHPGGETLGVAGLNSWWLDRSKPEDDETRWTLTATILTSDAVDELVGIHDRSPVPSRGNSGIGGSTRRSSATRRWSTRQ